MQVFDMSNGMTAHELFRQPYGWTFDDVIVLPHFSEVAAKQEVNLDSLLTEGLTVRLPIISSPMDTVTEWCTAVEMALHGGLGVIHMNLPIDQVFDQVRRVTRYQMGIIDNPLCRCPTDPISEIDAVKNQFGFSTILVTADGTPHTKLLGMVTKGHVAFEINKSAPLKEVMIPLAELMTVPHGKLSCWPEAREFLRLNPAAHKIPVLKPDGSVAGFVTRKDVVKMAQCPHALYDQATGQLRVGAAVSTHEHDDERVTAVIDAGVDVIIVDSAQGSTTHAVRRIQGIRQQKPTLPIIAGNVVTPSQALPLISAGASALRVGMGSGSICTTQEVIGIGRPQLSAVYHLAHYLREHGLSIPVISDGGIRNSGDIIKALVCGASTVMVGRLIAGCDETPARLEIHRDRRYKRYRGMGSPAALQKGSQYRYEQTPGSVPIIAQGTEGLVPAAGPLGPILAQLASALRTGLEYLGCLSIAMLHERVDSGAIRFELRSPAAREEGKPHDIQAL